jgi:rare lipoprotein A (peptidoglycan hydrolase)
MPGRVKPPLLKYLRLLLLLVVLGTIPTGQGIGGISTHSAGDRPNLKGENTKKGHFQDNSRVIIASWYSVQALKDEGTWLITQGRMANGKQFNENNFTCACRLYPIGTRLRITNTVNAKSVEVTVTDRIGKRFAKTRIDLSKRAFATIAPLEQGIVPITVEVLK